MLKVNTFRVSRAVHQIQATQVNQAGSFDDMSESSCLIDWQSLIRYNRPTVSMYINGTQESDSYT